MKKYVDAKSIGNDVKEIESFMNGLDISDELLGIHKDLWYSRPSRSEPGSTTYITKKNGKDVKTRVFQWIKNPRDIKFSLGYLCRDNIFEKVEALKFLNQLLNLGLNWYYSEENKAILGVDVEWKDPYPHLRQKPGTYAYDEALDITNDKKRQEEITARIATLKEWVPRIAQAVFCKEDNSRLLVEDIVENDHQDHLWVIRFQEQK